MSLTITKTSGVALSRTQYKGGFISTFRITNLDAVAKNLKIFLLASDDRSVAGSGNELGAEIVSEGMFQARKVGGLIWTVLAEPTFGDDWTGITGNILELPLAASDSIDIETRLVFPTNAESSGMINWDLKVMANAA